MPPANLSSLAGLAAASAIVLGDLAVAAGVVVPPVAVAALNPAVFACVDALAAGDRPRARRLAADLWAVVSRPGAFAAGDHWADEAIYCDGDPVTRRDAARAMEADGVNPAGVALFLGTAPVAHQHELAAAAAFYREDQERDHGRFAPSGGAAGAAERAKVAAEPVRPDTWAGKAGARTVGEARGLVAGLAKGRRVEHPNGSVGELTKLRGKPAVKFPDQTVTLDQMGREVQHLAPTEKGLSPTPNPPPGWQKGDHLAVAKETWMGKAGAKTVGDARKRLAKLPDGAKVVTPESRLATVESATGDDGVRRVSLKVPGRDPLPLDSVPAAQIADHRPVTKSPYDIKLKPDSPARRSTGRKTAGEALGAMEHLWPGTRITDHRTGRTGTLTKYRVGNNKFFTMKPGILYDGEQRTVPLEAYTGDLAQHLEVHKENLTPPEPDRPKSGFVELPQKGLLDRVMDRAWDALKGGVHRLLGGTTKDMGSTPATAPTPAPAPVPPPAPKAKRSPKAAKTKTRPSGFVELPPNAAQRPAA